MAYYEFTIKLFDTAKEALIAGLSEMGCLGMVDGEGTLVAYFPDVPGIESLLQRLTDLKQTLRESGLGADFSLDYMYLSERDWNESWKRRFQPIDVGERFSIVPPWEDKRSDRISLIIDPGMAFGTGHHETTKTCLALIERFSGASADERPGSPSPAEKLPSCGRRRRGREIFRSAAQREDMPPLPLWERAWMGSDAERRFLDIGTGTGILAIAAAKLGYGQVVAVDLDPLAVDATLRNVAANGLSNVKVKQGTLSDVTGAFEVIAANLLSETLIGLAPGIASHLARSGVAILSGIITGQEDGVIAAMVNEGLRLVEKHVDGRWVSLVFIKGE